MEIKPSKIMENFGRGFIEGTGVDSVLWAFSPWINKALPPSPIQVPGWHPPGMNTPWDDLITIGICSGATIYGIIKAVTKKDISTLVEGVSMLAGARTISEFQPAPYIPPWMPPVSVSTPIKSQTSEFSDLVKVD